MTNYLYLGLAIICEVIATSFLARSEGFSKFGPTAVALVGYAISFYLLSLTLRTVPTGVAYAIWSGVGIVLVSAVAYFWQGQKLDAPALAGMAMIVGGVLVINLFSKTAGH
ncbi:ethidium bromide resistance protein [Comamonas testosteroni]|uniref:Ethidium bromide resistance protein n=1 Tax=Comamonas testosteroni TaxID=285 RepID=A0A096H3C0_COMTE|nr:MULTISPECIES: SMR family transporter [Comamonas]KGH23272.1 multidrug transporter [Comamonas testosteroni]KOC21117.1 ethidium bromide resistance protein [Comamonas testosteroni]KWT71608.1 Ethidium bromide-methyl viologen resistance protein EmrE [Comamonas testosteroni]MDN5507231.1 SMR family transporter [Comamonas sp.]MDN5539244.1 SMR family transporter [Comamonas sp.]